MQDDFGWHTVVAKLQETGIRDAESAFRYIDADGGGTPLRSDRFSSVDRFRLSAVYCKPLGSISYEELLAAVKKLGLGSTAEDCKRMMLQADKDGNGEVDLDEFLAWQVKVAQENAKTA